MSHPQFKSHYTKNSLHEGIPRHWIMNNCTSIRFSIAGFKFIFIYFSQQNPSDNQNTVLFFLKHLFSFSFFITQNKRTLSAIRQRTLTVRCSLYLFTVHVYTHKKIVHHHYYISNLRPLTNIVDGAK